jgi:WD40 repeat protein|nr:protein kinase [Kofleriaceae bacterium]
MAGDLPRNDASTIGPSDDDLPAGAVGRAAPPGARYTIEDELSRGGLGRVMRGRDHNLDREVAIKQLLMHSARFEARFRREAQITARLQHPGIVPIYETGQLPGGEPFYAMKLVSGHTLRDELAGAATLDDRLALIPKVIAVCDAIAYAHGQRVIHRDLKPANVMVGAFGEVVVVDWGLAKDLANDRAEPATIEVRADGTASDGLTRDGTVLGTPPYLAPEQARGEPADARADVYALGAILYETLAGVPPHDARDADAALDRLRAGPPIAVGDHEPGAPRELIAIVDQAMARDRDARYPDAAALIADLRRFQTGQLVAAHRYSRASLVGRWLRRHRVAVTATALAIAAVAAIAAVSVSQIVDERDLAERARVAAEDAAAHARAETAAKEQRTNELELAQAKHWLGLDPTAALAWLKQYARGAAPDRAEIRALAIEAEQRGAAIDAVRGLVGVVLARDGTVIGYDAATRVAVWRPGAAIEPISAALPGFRQVAASRDGRYVAWGDAGVTLWDRTTKTARALAPQHGTRTPSALAFVGDELAIGEADGTIRVVSLRDGTTRTFDGGGEVRDLVASPDGALLASTTTQPAVRLWTVSTGAARELPAESAILVVAFSPAGDRLAWAGRQMPIHWLDVASPSAVHALAGTAGVQTTSLAFSPDGHTLASGGNGIRVDDLVSGARRDLPEVHTDWVNSLAYSADGGVLVSAQSHGGPIVAWDVATGDRRALLGHATSLWLMRFADDGVLVTADRTPQVRRWRIPGSTERVLERATGDAHVLAATGTGVVGAHANHPVAWRDATSPAHGPPATATSDVATELVAMPGGSAGGERVAFGDRAGDLWLWTPATDALAKLAHVDGAGELAVSPEGRALAVGCDDGSLAVVDVATHAVRTLGKLRAVVTAVAFSPDGARVATASMDTSLTVWDVAAGTSQLLGKRGHAVGALAFSPDGTLAAGRDRGLVELYAPDGRERDLRGHEAGVLQLAYLDAATLASTSDDGTIRVWDVAAGTARVMHQQGHVQALAVLPGGRLATGNAVDGTGDATVRIWDVATAQLIAEHRGHAGGVLALAMVGDGAHLASLGADNTIRVWPLDAPAAVPAADRAWLDTLSTVELGDHDVVASPVR